jgi:hypothetical protein
MKKQISIFALVCCCMVSYAQHDHASHAAAEQSKNTPSFKDEKIGSVYNQYTRLKDALVASNKDDAKKAAAELAKSLSATGSNKSLADQATSISASTDIDAQRKLFSTLSNDMATLIKSSKLSAGQVYLDYCPMANNNEGAFWLSNEKQIKNPYFGDMMLTCGSVKETIQQ